METESITVEFFTAKFFDSLIKPYYNWLYIHCQQYILGAFRRDSVKQFMIMMLITFHFTNDCLQYMVRTVCSYSSNLPLSRKLYYYVKVSWPWSEPSEIANLFEIKGTVYLLYVEFVCFLYSKKSPCLSLPAKLNPLTRI